MGLGGFMHSVNAHAHVLSLHMKLETSSPVKSVLVQYRYFNRIIKFEPNSKQTEREIIKGVRSVFADRIAAEDRLT